MAQRLGIGALTSAFVDLLEAKHWVEEYYSLIKSDECLPIGHGVNANIAMVTSFSLHQNREEVISRGLRRVRALRIRVWLIVRIWRAQTGEN